MNTYHKKEKGSHEWLLQKYTTVALIALWAITISSVCYFLVSSADNFWDAIVMLKIELLSWLLFPYDSKFMSLFASPFFSAFAIMMVALTIKHCQLEMKEICEDYIENKTVLIVGLAKISAVSIFAIIVASLFVIRMHISQNFHLNNGSMTELVSDENGSDINDMPEITYSYETKNS